jgi:hypothetical protein
VTVVFHISGHGFGHAARQIEIINALHDARPDVSIVVRTAAARWLFERTLRAPARFEHMETDTGAVQRGALEVDVLDTIRQAEVFHRDLDVRIASETAALERIHAHALVADVPPLAFAAAARAGIPGVAIANFTWDWIYAGYPETDREAPALVARLRACYALATEGWRLPMHGGFDGIDTLRELPFVARHGLRDPTAVRSSLGLPRATPLALVSFGGFRAAGIDVEAAARSLRGVAELVVTSNDAFPAIADVHRLDERAMYDGGFRYEDLVRAVDIVISKPGYGIISECVANGAALLYTSRGRFREYEVLVAEMPKYLRCAFLAQEPLLGGNWREAVVGLLAQPHVSPRPATNGAEVAARWLSEFLRR